MYGGILIDRTIIHNTFVRHSTQASKNWEQYTAILESNKALKKDLADLKVEVKKMEKFSLSTEKTIPAG